MNVTDETTEGQITFITIFTSTAGVIIALLGFLSAIVLYKTRMLSSSSKCDNNVVIKMDVKCSNRDIERFIQHAADQGIQIEGDGDIQVKDVLNIIQQTNHNAISSDEYKNIFTNGINMSPEEIQDTAFKLISMVLDSMVLDLTEV